MIKIKKQGFISEVGKRQNNEDNCGYLANDTYVVCDGVGGSEKGEIASDITVRTFISVFQKNPNATIQQVLKQVEQQISTFIQQNPDSNGMATTLTFSKVRKNDIHIAWVGDSRVYQFRNGKICFQTKDHSWVNEALAAGLLTEEEAIDHPKSNIITRAIQGTHKPTQADEVFLTDVKAGDYFFHCSDGVLESWDDANLERLFATNQDPEKLLEAIKAACAQHSRDNYTAIVYQIGDVIAEPEGAAYPTEPVYVEAQLVQDMPHAAPPPPPKPQPHTPPTSHRPPTPNTHQRQQAVTSPSSKSRFLVTLAFLLLLCLVGFFARDYFLPSQSDAKTGTVSDTGNKTKPVTKPARGEKDQATIPPPQKTDDNPKQQTDPKDSLTYADFENDRKKTQKQQLKDKYKQDCVKKSDWKRISDTLAILQ
jgi:serine/threonine protein phosphatase PrpC